MRPKRIIDHFILRAFLGLVIIFTLFFVVGALLILMKSRRLRSYELFEHPHLTITLLVLLASAIPPLAIILIVRRVLIKKFLSLKRHLDSPPEPEKVKND